MPESASGGGVSALGGGVCSRGRGSSRGGGGGIPACTEADTLLVNRITNRCKNITLATTSLRPVIALLSFLVQIDFFYLDVTKLFEAPDLGGAVDDKEDIFFVPGSKTERSDTSLRRRLDEEDNSDLLK